MGNMGKWSCVGIRHFCYHLALLPDRVARHGGQYELVRPDHGVRDYLCPGRLVLSRKPQVLGFGAKDKHRVRPQIHTTGVSRSSIERLLYVVTVRD